MVVVALVGASGNFGHKILPVLLTDDIITGVHVLSRHASNELTHPKVRHFQVDYSDSARIREALRGCDVLINAMGTNLNHIESKVRLVDVAAEIGVKVYFPR